MDSRPGGGRGEMLEEEALRGVGGIYSLPAVRALARQ